MGSGNSFITGNSLAPRGAALPPDWIGRLPEVPHPEFPPGIAALPTSSFMRVGRSCTEFHIEASGAFCLDTRTKDDDPAASYRSSWSQGTASRGLGLPAQEEAFPTGWKHIGHWRALVEEKSRGLTFSKEHMGGGVIG